MMGTDISIILSAFQAYKNSYNSEMKRLCGKSLLFYYFNSKTITENGGILSLMTSPFKEAFENVCGFILSGFSNVL